MIDEPVDFQQVFYRHLKELNLSDFPTGDGKWRNNLNWESDLLHSKQYGNLADLFTNESLNDLANHVIFKKNTDWSKSVDDVVAKSIQHPKQKLKNIYSYFKTLRFVNEKITSIDSSISQFDNLNELTLTSNNIKSLDLKVLPASLQVLELCGNSVSDVDFLCTTPTNLHYIGLGYNSITSLSRFYTASYFNSLLYLDLSFNLLDDLKGSVKALTHIPKLRVLLFQGNPLFLCMGYRGYVIDSLPNLTSLDDTEISPDERQLFKGISEMDHPFDRSMLKIIIDEFQNTPDNDESQAEDYPKNVYTYFMKFDFIEKEDILEESLMSPMSSPVTKKLDDSIEKKSQDELALVQNSVEKKDVVDDSNPIIMTNTKPGIVTSKDSKTLEELTLETSITLQNSKTLHEFLLNNINVKLYKTSTLLNTIPKPSDDAHCDISLAPRPSKMKGSNTTIASVGKSASKSLSKSTASKMKPPSAVPPAPAKEGKKDKKDKKAAEVAIYEWSKTTDVIGHAHVSCNLILEGASIVSCFTPFRHPSTVKDEHNGNDSVVPCMQVVTETILDSEQIQIKVANHDTDDVTVKKNTMPVIQTSEYIDDAHDSKHSDEYTQGCFSVDEDVPEAQIRLELTRWGSTKESLEWVARNVKRKQDDNVEM